MEQSGNAMGNDAGFTAAGTGENEEGTFDEANCLPLRFVQAFEKMRRDFLFHGNHYSERSQSRNRKIAVKRQQTEIAKHPAGNL